MIPRFHGVGYIGNQPKILQTAKGTLIATLDVAFSEQYNGEQQTVWMKCTAFGSRAEIIQKYFKKGSRIELICKLNQERYTDKNGQQRSNIVGIIEQIGFIDAKGTSNAPAPEKQQPAAAKKEQHSAQETPQIDVDDDDIPF